MEVGGFLVTVFLSRCSCSHLCEYIFCYYVCTPSAIRHWFLAGLKGIMFSPNIFFSSPPGFSITPSILHRVSCQLVSTGPIHIVSPSYILAAMATGFSSARSGPIRNPPTLKTKIGMILPCTLSRPHTVEAGYSFSVNPDSI